MQHLTPIYFVLVFWLLNVSNSFYISKILPTTVSYRKVVACASSSNVDVSVELINNFKSWASEKTVESMLPKQKIYKIIEEIKRSPNAALSIKPIYNDVFSKIEVFIETEQRSIKQLLGVEASTRFLNSVEQTNIYDATTVRAFLISPIFEKMIGTVLYEGIFQFIQKIDFVGNVVNKLPLLGPLRQNFVVQFKKVLDVVVGDELKKFLAGFNRVAVQRMVDFILSKENSKYLLQANKNLVDSIISRPIVDIVSISRQSRQELKEDFWVSINTISENELKVIADTFYANFADYKFNLIGETIDQIPVLKSTLAEIVDEYLQSPQGQKSIQLLSKNQ